MNPVVQNILDGDSLTLAFSKMLILKHEINLVYFCKI